MKLLKNPGKSVPKFNAKFNKQFGDGCLDRIDFNKKMDSDIENIEQSLKTKSGPWFDIGNKDKGTQ